MSGLQDEIHICASNKHNFIRFEWGEQATSLQINPTTNELRIAHISPTWAIGSDRGYTVDLN